jgi:hypothetical protein
MKIYDQDINMWTATVEHHELQLRVALPAKETECRNKVAAAKKVLDALCFYKSVVEMYPVGHASAPEPFDA